MELIDNMVDPEAILASQAEMRNPAYEAESVIGRIEDETQEETASERTITAQLSEHEEKLGLGVLTALMRVTGREWQIVVKAYSEKRYRAVAEVLRISPLSFRGEASVGSRIVNALSMLNAQDWDVFRQILAGRLPVEAARLTGVSKQAVSVRLKSIIDRTNFGAALCNTMRHNLCRKGDKLPEKVNPREGNTSVTRAREIKVYQKTQKSVKIKNNKRK